MAYFTFHGGIELETRKERTRDKNIEKIFPGKYLVFPMEHGEEPQVFPGAYVFVGQLLAKTPDDFGYRIHASASGVIHSIEERTTAQGEPVLSIVLENDGIYREMDFGGFVDTETIDQSQILESIRNAGIVDAVQGEPIYGRLAVKEPNKIRHIIVRCTESEPYLTSQYRCAVERPEWIIEGLRILLSVFPNAKGILALENGQQEAITALQKILADSPNIKIIPMKCKYPQDTERMLIYACTGKKIPSSKTAEDARCIVLGADTVYAVCNAVSFGKPMYERLLTVSGECIQNPKNMEVPVGTLLLDIMTEIGSWTENPDRIICGGIMTGQVLKNLDVPVTKEMTALLCVRDEKGNASGAVECIGCGFCVDVCNEQLLPTRLAKCAVKNNQEKFLKLGGMECCECGACSYVCPSRIELTQMIREMKNSILQKSEN